MIFHANKGGDPFRSELQGFCFIVGRAGGVLQNYKAFAS